MKLKALAFALFFFNLSTIVAQNNGKLLPDGSYYTCTMDPKVHNDKPGICSICGMEYQKNENYKPGGHDHSDHEGHNH